MSSPRICAAILTHNEATMLPGCVSTLKWCDEILALDQGSTDGTLEVLAKAGVRVIHSDETSFAVRRTQLLKACQADWIIYIDADERVTPLLAEEIRALISAHESSQDPAIGQVPRKNFFFGKVFKHGGWQNEYCSRVFKTDVLKGWQGDIHESPIFEGEVKQLVNPLWHFTHRSVADGLVKTAQWTPVEATLIEQQLGKTQTKISLWTIVRKGLGELWRRGVKQGGWRDGAAGMIEVLTQMINRMLVYMQVWEKQQQPPIREQYDRLEDEMASLWKKQ
jgi:glycosyltransferase involved in cell wall biosynthesis